MSTQPEALQLAEYHEHLADIPPKAAEDGFILRTARELRRLHALNGELLKALKDAAWCVQNNYMPDMCGDDWDEVIAKAEGGPK
jgi:hypothetical protein